MQHTAAAAAAANKMRWGQKEGIFSISATKVKIGPKVTPEVPLPGSLGPSKLGLPIGLPV